MNKPAAKDPRRGRFLAATALLTAIAGSVIVLTLEIAVFGVIEPASVLRCVVLSGLCGVVWLGNLWARRILIAFIAAKLVLLLLNILDRPDSLRILFATLLAVSLALLTTYRSVHVFWEAQRRNWDDWPEDPKTVPSWRHRIQRYLFRDAMRASPLLRRVLHFTRPRRSNRGPRFADLPDEDPVELES